MRLPILPDPTLFILCQTRASRILQALHPQWLYYIHLSVIASEIDHNILKARQTSSDRDPSLSHKSTLTVSHQRAVKQTPVPNWRPIHHPTAPFHQQHTRSRLAPTLLQVLPHLLQSPVTSPQCNQCDHSWRKRMSRSRKSLRLPVFS